MRRILAALLIILLAAPASAKANARLTPNQTLTAALNADMQQLGRYSGAYVVDLKTGQALYAVAPQVARTPASVEKLYTTSTALLMFGPNATLTTQLLGVGQMQATNWGGLLYLRGGGDPTFGSASFASARYGSAATVERLVANWRSSAGVTAVRGSILGDASLFDSAPGTIASGFAFDPYMEGSLSALAFDRGLLTNGSPVTNPAGTAAGHLADAFRSAGVTVGTHLYVGAAQTPAAARLLATVQSPDMAQLIALTNTPSDNFFAETLTKDLGARFGTGGTTAAGVAVIKSVLASRLGLWPRFDDGSGLSYDDETTPSEVVSLLRQMANRPNFVRSLAIGGQTGTLEFEMRGTAAQGACRGKTGTLSTVASLAGYCQAADGHTLAFAVLANALGNPTLGHAIEADMAAAMARYNG